MTKRDDAKAALGDAVSCAAGKDREHARPAIKHAIKEAVDLIIDAAKEEMRAEMVKQFELVGGGHYVRARRPMKSMFAYEQDGPRAEEVDDGDT